MEEAQVLSLVAAAHRLSWKTPSFVVLKERMLRGGHESPRWSPRTHRPSLSQWEPPITCF